MNGGVRFFLENLGMLKYYDIFCAKGFDLESDIPHISLSDLEDSMMIESCEDRTIIYQHAQRFQPSAEYILYGWLHSHSLDHYYENFIQSELVHLKDVTEIQLPDESLYDELEIVLPGHQKRLERAVAKLREEKGRNAPVEIPVTQGWWGKPDCLPQAKFDFLCVTANLFASHEPRKKARIDFMVDSGSDVSTVQEKTLESLNLDLLGRVYSCGIHGGNYTNLYKAQLEVGDEKLDIEVMGSNYDSLGSRILRHFRHVIDGKRHIWLKGYYKDPLPAILPLATPSKSAFDSGMKSLAYKPIPKPLQNDSKPQRPSPPPLSSTSSSSSENVALSSNEKENATKNDKDSQVTMEASLSQSDSGLISSSPVCVTRLPHDNDEDKPGISANQTASDNGQTAISSGFIPFSSLSTGQNGQIRLHFQSSPSENLCHGEKMEEDVNSHSRDSSISDIHNHSLCANTVNSRDEGKGLKEIKRCLGMSNQSSGGSSTEADEVICKIETNTQCDTVSHCNGLNIQKSQLLTDQSMDSKSAGQKRHMSSPLNSYDKCKKVQKLGKDGQTILQGLRDTDDDIDNMNNPFCGERSNHLRSLQVKPKLGAISGENGHILYSAEDQNVLFKDFDMMDSKVEKDTKEEVIHILCENGDVEEESLLHSNKEGCDRGLESMRHSSNFLPGLGISIMIPVDDLEESELNQSFGEKS